MSDGYSLLPPAGQIKSKLHVAADLSLVTQSYTTTCFLVVKLKKQSKRQIQNQNTHRPGFPAPAGLWHSGSCFFSNQLYTVMSSASLWTRSTVQSSSQTEPARTRCLSEPGRGQRGGGGGRSHSGMDGGQSTSTDWDTNNNWLSTFEMKSL